MKKLNCIYLSCCILLFSIQAEALTLIYTSGERTSFENQLGATVTDPKRIETLLILMALAHIFCTSEGARKERDGEAKKNAAKGALSVPLVSFSSVSKPSNNSFDEPQDAVLSPLFAVSSASWNCH